MLMNGFVGGCIVGWAMAGVVVVGWYMHWGFWMCVVESMLWTTLVGDGGALASLAVSSSHLWSAVLLCRSPMLIARMASANSL